MKTARRSDPSGEWMNTDEVATRLGVHTSTVWDFIKKHNLRTKAVSRGLWRPLRMVWRADVERLLTHKELR